MNLLRPNEDDYAFARANTKLGWNKAVRRCMRLRSLLERSLTELRTRRDPPLTPIDILLHNEIDQALKQTFYDEPETPPEGEWDKKS